MSFYHSFLVLWFSQHYFKQYVLKSQQQNYKIDNLLVKSNKNVDFFHNTTYNNIEVGKMKVESCGERIKKALRIRGKKNSDLAYFLKIDRGTITNYINDKYAPKTDRLNLMAQYLNVDPVWLLGYNVPMESHHEKIKKDDEKTEIIISSLKELSDPQKQIVLSMVKELIKANKKEGK